MKHHLRKAMLEKLNGLSIETKQSINDHIHKNLFNSKLWNKAQVIGVTLSYKPEWDTYEIIKQAWKDNKEVVVPVTNELTYTMKFYLINSLKDLKEGNYKIYEPISQTKERYYEKSTIDLMIVPGVVFDKHGYRIGFGKGYFDRYLNDFNNNKVALLAEFQLIEQIPTNQYDINVDYLITDKKIFKVKK